MLRWLAAQRQTATVLDVHVELEPGMNALGAVWPNASISQPVGGIVQSD